MNTLTTTIIISIFMFATSAFAQDFKKLTIMSEEFSPFQYTENGEIKGTAVDFLLKATEAAGEPIRSTDIKMVAWARGYKMVLSGPNTMLFLMSRTEERENLFKWAGPMSENRIVIFAKKSSGFGEINDITTLSDRLGVIREDIGDQLATKAGVPPSVFVRGSKPESIAKMLAVGRVKLWAFPEGGGLSTLESIGENTDDYEIVHVLKTTGLYYAFSKDVDNRIVAKLQAGIDQIKGSAQ
jgi:ABC-type amino acid transport substrate-binding protein